MVVASRPALEALPQELARNESLQEETPHWILDNSGGLNRLLMQDIGDITPKKSLHVRFRTNGLKAEGQLSSASTWLNIPPPVAIMVYLDGVVRQNVVCRMRIRWSRSIDGDSSSELVERG